MSSITSYLKSAIATFCSMVIGIFAALTGALTLDVIQVVTGVALFAFAYVVSSEEDEEEACCDEDH
jgi:hypothetical protein